MSLRRTLRLCLSGLVSATVLVAGCTTNPGPQRCEAQVYRALAQASIRKNDVRSLRVAVYRSQRKSERYDRVEGWVRLRSCSGNVVVVMSGTCFVHQSYTTGDCRASGLRSSRP